MKNTIITTMMVLVMLIGLLTGLGKPDTLSKASDASSQTVIVSSNYSK